MFPTNGPIGPGWFQTYKIDHDSLVLLLSLVQGLLEGFLIRLGRLDQLLRGRHGCRGAIGLWDSVGSHGAGVVSGTEDAVRIVICGYPGV